ncbi:MAG: DEAD/DEAH box helicase [Rhodocyclaceae bacterium]|nr:DEAD/DEAH box helicase [Rhodocyclaceae bacterium]
MPSTPAPLNPFHQSLANIFGHATLMRGMDYAAQGRAVIHDVSRSKGEIQVTGRCRGTRFYDVTLWMHPHMEKITSTCSCPMGGDCKHVVALLLALFEAGSGFQAPVIAQAASPVESLMSSRKTQEWLDSLSSAESTPKAPVSDYRIVYMVHEGPPLRLSLGRCRPLKKGGFSKPSKYRVEPYDFPEHAASYRVKKMSEEDVLPLRLFMSLTQDTYSRTNEVNLKGAGGVLLLEQTLATGRLFAVNPKEESLPAAPLRLSDPHVLAWKWMRDAKNRQQLMPDLSSDQSVLRLWPSFCLDRAAGTLARVSTDLSEAMFNQLLVAPPIEDADAWLVQSRLQRVVGCPVPETPEVVEAGMPRARLVLAMGRFRYQSLSGLYDEKALVDLFFDYPEGVTVGGVETLDSPILCQQKGKTIRRNLEAEAIPWRVLQGLGLESFRQRLPGHVRLTPPPNAGECLLPLRQDATHWLPLLSEGIPALEEAGVEVTIADDFPFRVTQSDDWFVALDEEPGCDWFNLDLGVMVNGQRVSLVPPLVRLFKTTPDLLQKVQLLPETQTWPVAIDEKHILPIPVARLKAWLVPLLEFLEHDRPRVSRYHAAALEGLADAKTQWIGSEEIRVLGQRLANFSGMTTVLPAEGFTAELRSYQQAGLDWLQFLREFGLSGILADDMGLGKTVQALAHLHLEKTSGRANLPSLIIAPTSLMPNWRNEAAKFTPSLKVLTLHGSDRFERFGEIPDADLILTTYPLLVRDREILLAQKFHLLVLDEAQFIKNPRAQSHQVSRRLVARHRLSLTGTPLENHLGELWAQFDFLMPGFLGSEKRFGQCFRAPIEKMGDGQARNLLAERVKPFLLRRTKEAVLQELPPRTDMIRWVELEGGQRDLYESLRVSFDKKLREVLAEQGVARSQIMILDALLKLRKTCCDPRLVKLPTAVQLGKKGIESSAKLTTLMALVEELLDEGRKILLFSQFTSMLDLIEIELKRLNIAFVRISGDTKDRETPVRDFQEGRVPLFLISLKAGGTGLNLTAADTVIHYDPWWNPAVEEQATARAHRIGQEKPVFVYKLMTEGTVEEKILALQDRKRGLSDQLLKGDSGKGGHRITAEDLNVLFQPLPAG